MRLSRINHNPSPPYGHSDGDLSPSSLVGVAPQIGRQLVGVRTAVIGGWQWSLNLVWFAQQPIIIGSGYRCPQLNVKVGGVYASQHTLGEAADIYIPKTAYTDWDDNKAHTDKELAERWFLWLQSHTDYDQLIMETSNGRDYWIHVSCRANRKKNRHQIFRDIRKK